MKFELVKKYYYIYLKLIICISVICYLHVYRLNITESVSVVLPSLQLGLLRSNL